MPIELALYPWPALLTGSIIALAVCALGFKRTDWFVSVSYGFSISALAVIFPLLLWGRWDLWAGLQSLLLVAYGVRLATHILSRETRASYSLVKEGSTMRASKPKLAIRLTMWVSVAILYVLMYSPALMTLNAQASGNIVASLPYGLAVMLVGLIFEGLGDWQKTAAKTERPNDFVSTGLYRIVRFPNYFGEMLFWGGVWVSGISAYSGVLDWIVASLGILAIQGVMLGSAKSLEARQDKSYGDRADYQAYVKSTPILFPLVPLYTMNKR